MNDFERLQRGILDSTNSFWNARYIGRACYAPVTEDLRIKAELYSTHVAARYDALKLTVISNKNGMLSLSKVRSHVRSQQSARTRGTRLRLLPHPLLGHHCRHLFA